MKKKRKLKNWVVITFIIIFLISTMFFSIRVILWRIGNNQNKKIERKVNKKINIKINKKNKDYKYKIDFKALKKQNSDTIAYIKVNNTKIDYVVVKTNDNDYYLKHNFDKKYNVSGWIFGDYKNKFDGTDKNLVIYGHNTSNGSMFGTLKKTLNNDWFENKDNHIILLITEKNTYYYEVFSTYTIIPEDYYINTNFKDSDEFNKFVKKIKSRSVNNYKTEVNDTEKILTLSSCINNGNKRVVLHAKLIKTE